MSLGDMFDFEQFQLEEWWDKIKDQPESLVLGVDPISTGFWNELGVGGGNQEPLVNVLGGPMGGGWHGTGSGGIYDRAEEAGIDTSDSMLSHDVAEAVAAFYAGQGLMGIGDGGGGATGGEGFNWQDFGQNLMRNPPQMSSPQQQPQQTQQYQFNRQMLPALVQPDEEEKRRQNNAMSLLLQQHRG